MQVFFQKFLKNPLAKQVEARYNKEAAPDFIQTGNREGVAAVQAIVNFLMAVMVSVASDRIVKLIDKWFDRHRGK